MGSDYCWISISFGTLMPLAIPEHTGQPEDVLLGRKVLGALSRTEPAESVQCDCVVELAPGKLYELTGESNSGKSVVVQDVLISCLLRGHAAVIVDCDYRLDVLGLLEKIRELCNAELLLTVVDISRARNLSTSFSKSMLRRLTIQKCANLTELQLFVGFRLPQLLLSEPVSVVAIDSLTSFYWHERYATPNVLDAYSTLWQRIASLAKQFGVTAISTMQNLFRQQASPFTNDRPFLRPAGLDVTAALVKNLGQGKFALEFADRTDVYQMNVGQLARVSTCVKAK
ncbi:DNA repair protein XRCC2-like [Tropilaelaps mercedesae]|uniref:DNA repair protein XRCC2-like n=1 Tax=Tropilaelaps mercedesae TaxID=418985 RepID=A0A1V9XLT3_9ACAR|nr:DNA repair protein XRCC2-like [Tropilaelaps mercedesae]